MKTLFFELIDLLNDGTITERDLNYALSNLVLSCQMMQEYNVI